MPAETSPRRPGSGSRQHRHNLQTLKQAGLLATSREGTTIRYRLADDDVAALYDQLRTIAAAHLPDVAAARRSYLGAPDTEEIDRDELLRRAQAGDVIVLDVRPPLSSRPGTSLARFPSRSTS